MNALIDPVHHIYDNELVTLRSVSYRGTRTWQAMWLLHCTMDEKRIPVKAYPEDARLFSIAGYPKTLEHGCDKHNLSIEVLLTYTQEHGYRVTEVTPKVAAPIQLLSSIERVVQWNADREQAVSTKTVGNVARMYGKTGGSYIVWEKMEDGTYVRDCAGVITHYECKTGAVS
jgi:hypothetical protein